MENENTVGRIRLSAIYAVFLVIGLTSFGPSMVIESKKTLVEKKNWYSEKEFLDGLALAQLIPGATYVSLSIYLGYSLRRLPGAAASFLGFVTAPFILMTILSWLYFKYQSIEYVSILFKGLGAVVVAIIFHTVIGLAKATAYNIKAFLIAAIAIAVSLIYYNVFLILLVSALLGIFLIRKKAPVDEKQDFTKIHFVDICWTDIAIVCAATVLFFLLTVLSGDFFILAGTLYKIGALVFGNGYTMLPLIQQEVVNVHHWLTLQDFMAGVGLGQITPGPVSITATFIGYRFMGVFGAAVSTLSIFAPSFLYVTLTYGIYSKIKQIMWVNSALTGILASFTGLMVLVVINTAKYALSDFYTIGLSILSLFALLILKLDTKWVILAGTGLYLIAYFLIHSMH